MILEITPQRKPRITYRGKWSKQAQAYYEYANALREASRGYVVPDKLFVRFYLPMPNSWSKKKRVSETGRPHKQRPDIDNLVKAFLDALCSDDKYVYAVRAEKYWSEQGRIEVEEY